MSGRVISGRILGVFIGKHSRRRRRHSQPFWNSTGILLEAFQGVCRGHIGAVGRRVIDPYIDPYQFYEKCYSPTARRSAGASSAAAEPEMSLGLGEPGRASHGLQGSGGTRPSVTETGTIRPSSAMRPIMTGL